MPVGSLLGDAAEAPLRPCRWLCDFVGELCSKQGPIYPYPFGWAAATYLTIIALAAVFVIVRPRRSYVARVMHYNWSRTAAIHVWAFALLIFLGNGFIHTLAQTNWLQTPGGASRLPLGDYLSADELLRLLFNVPFLLVVLVYYILDFYGGTLLIEIAKRATAYLGPVGLAWVTEETFNAYWDRFHGRAAVAKFTHHLPGWPPEYIVAAVVFFVLTLPPGLYFRKNIYSAIVMPPVVGALLSIAIIGIVAAAGLIVMSHHEQPLMLSQRP